MKDHKKEYFFLARTAKRLKRGGRKSQRRPRVLVQRQRSLSVLSERQRIALVVVKVMFQS